MTGRARDETPRPLPREWLPEPTPLEGTPEWRSMAERIITGAEHEMGKRTAAIAEAWPAILGSLWKPAAALAAAAAALLLVLHPEPAHREPDASALPLRLVAAEGEPLALLEGLGIRADPVLAMIAFEGPADMTDQEAIPTTPERENR